MSFNDIHHKSITNDCLNELVSLIRPILKQGLQSIYDTVCNGNNKINIMLFREFQIELEKVPSWNNVMIDKEYERFVVSTRCDWLGDLIIATFKASANNILSSIQSNTENDMSIDLIVPLPQHFIHYCYIEIARLLWKKPQLFYENVSTINKQTNDDLIDEYIETGIKRTINKNIPYNNLLKNTNSSTNNNSLLYEEQTSNSKAINKDSSFDIIDHKLIQEDTPYTRSTSHEKTIDDNDVNSAHIQTLPRAASFVAPRRDNINESDEDNDTLSNASDDEQYSSDTYSQDAYEMDNTLIDHTKENMGNVDTVSINLDNQMALQTTQQEYPVEKSYEQYFKHTNTNIVHNTPTPDNTPTPFDHVNNTTERLVVPQEKTEQYENFEIDLNKTIKEIYINEKRKKNEKKIKKILGVNMSYDSFIQQDKRKLRNFLMLNKHIPKIQK